MRLIKYLKKQRLKNVMDKIKSITANIAFIHTIILKTLMVFLLRQNRQNIQFYYRSIMSLKNH